jgi:ABC-type glycerol-3-phosphate transport system permease component
MKKAIIYVVLIVFLVIFIYPFLWMVSASLRPEEEIGGFGIIPSRLTLEHYKETIHKIPIFRAFLNSLIVAGSVTAGVLVFGSMVGYALSRLQFKGRNAVFLIILFTMTLPFQITLIPLYVLMVKFGWVNSYLALIMPYLISGFSIILFRQFFKSIPQDLIDAARIDGCNDFYILFRVLWPLSVPTLITVGILTFMTMWNEVLWPLIVIRDRALMTMPQLVAIFHIGGQAEARIGVKLAAAILLALPIVLAYSFFQRYFIQSMATSGLKE